MLIFKLNHSGNTTSAKSFFFIPLHGVVGKSLELSSEHFPLSFLSYRMILLNIFFRYETALRIVCILYLLLFPERF